MLANFLPPWKPIEKEDDESSAFVEWWRKRHLQWDELTPAEHVKIAEEHYYGPDGASGDLGVKPREEFERVQRETGYRPMRQIGPGAWIQEPSRMKFMIVVYRSEHVFTNCIVLGCKRKHEFRAVVLADVKDNRERIESGCGFEEWSFPAHVVPTSFCEQMVYAKDLRGEPTLYRSEVLDLCPYHRSDGHIMGCFTRFKKDKHLKRVVVSPRK